MGRYLELCQPKFPKALQTVETPFLDESKPEFDENPVNPAFDKLFNQKDDVETISAWPGGLEDAAAQVLMNVQALASRVTK